MPDAIDFELVARVRAGDRDAFERFFRHWYPRLARHAARLTGTEDTAEDVVQELFVTLWRRRESLPEAAKLPAYLYRAVRNRALNQLRQQRTAGRLAEALEPNPEVPPVAESALLEAELAERVRVALAALPPRTREIFTMNRDDGLTYTAIADTLGISVKTVETLMGRALRSLRETLRDSLVEPP